MRVYERGLYRATGVFVALCICLVQSAWAEPEVTDELQIESLLDEVELDVPAAESSPVVNEGESRSELDAVLEQKEREITELKRALVSAADRRGSDPAYRAEVSKLQLEVQTLTASLRAAQIRMHYNLGTMHMRLKEYDKAERAFQAVLKIDADDAATHYNLGILFDDHLEKPEAAALHYGRFLELEPTSPDADQVMQWLRQVRASRLRPER